MPLDLSYAGRAQDPVSHVWSADDALLYAVAVGAGAQDPSAELAFTTENTEGVAQQVLPTFVTLLGSMLPPGMLAGVAPGMFVHAEEEITLHRPLPVAGDVVTRVTITDIYDKGSGALVMSSAEVSDRRGGAPIATVRRGVFIRGEGAFGGHRGPPSEWAAPDRAPDATVSFPVPAGQPLVYRLCGDRNRLHSDPVVGRSAGYGGPLVHGLCVYGYTGRALLGSLCDGEPARFGTMRARFVKPVRMRDERLTVAIWHDGDGARFETRDRDGDVVLGRGEFARRA